VSTFGVDHGSARRHDFEQRQRELRERRLPELARYDRSAWHSVVVIGFEQLRLGNVHAHVDATTTARRHHDHIFERNFRPLTERGSS
jgi:hypothetical protein